MTGSTPINARLLVLSSTIVWDEWEVTTNLEWEDFVESAVTHTII